MGKDHCVNKLHPNSIRFERYCQKSRAYRAFNRKYYHHLYTSVASKASFLMFPSLLKTYQLLQNRKSPRFQQTLPMMTPNSEVFREHLLLCNMADRFFFLHDHPNFVRLTQMLHPVMMGDFDCLKQFPAQRVLFIGTTVEQE